MLVRMRPAWRAGCHRYVAVLTHRDGVTSSVPAGTHECDTKRLVTEPAGVKPTSSLPRCCGSRQPGGSQTGAGEAGASPCGHRARPGKPVPRGLGEGTCTTSLNKNKMRVCLGSTKMPTRAVGDKADMAGRPAAVHKPLVHSPRVCLMDLEHLGSREGTVSAEQHELASPRPL